MLVHQEMVDLAVVLALQEKKVLVQTLVKVEHHLLQAIFPTVVFLVLLLVLLH
jgi:hypothetical protein